MLYLAERLLWSPKSWIWHFMSSYVVREMFATKYCAFILVDDYDRWIRTTGTELKNSAASLHTTI